MVRKEIRITLTQAMGSFYSDPNHKEGEDFLKKYPPKEYAYFSMTGIGFFARKKKKK